MTKAKIFYRFYRQDIFASISLFLISLPITIGIAVASHAPPEAGIISAIFAAFFFGFFSSSPVALYGPAAGLCVFLAAHAQHTGSANQVANATIITGAILMVLSDVRAHRIIHLLPVSVIKGMAVGIGLTLILKMIPHLLGFDHTVLESVDFTDIDSTGGNTWSDLAASWALLSPGALIISIISLGLIWAQNLYRKNHEDPGIRASHIPYAFLVILIGAAINWIFTHYFPGLSLNENQMIHMRSASFSVNPPPIVTQQWWPSIRLAFIITTVILLEGFINLELIQKMDPKRAPINAKREMFLLGIANFIIGWMGTLPVMPILIRSAANIEFGAKTRLSQILQGLWLLLAFWVSTFFDHFPMATVAALLVAVGLNLIHKTNIPDMAKKGRSQIVPFALTVIVILSVDLLWGIFVGFAVGIFFSLRSMVERTMLVVQDGQHYMLKFFKDVTFIHKAELKDHLDQVPAGKTVLIDGTGNISIDPEIEDWLVEYQTESKLQGRNVIFSQSQLAVSKLFKGAKNG